MPNTGHQDFLPEPLQDSERLKTQLTAMPQVQVEATPRAPVTSNRGARDLVAQVGQVEATPRAPTNQASKEFLQGLWPEWDLMR